MSPSTLMSDPRIDSSLEDIVEIVRLHAPRDAKVLEETNLLTELDLDSLQLAELFAALEKRYGVDILSRLQDIRAVETPRKILAFVVAAR